FLVIGSSRLAGDALQQADGAPEAACRAAAPYLSFTACLISIVLICFPSFSHKQPARVQRLCCGYSIRHREIPRAQPKPGNLPDTAKTFLPAAQRSALHSSICPGGGKESSSESPIPR